MQYESSVADANVLYSAKVIKAKFKIEDTVRCDHLLIALY